MQTKKMWYESKVLWINIISLMAIVFQIVTNNELVIDAETQALLLGVVNMVLRVVTKDEITFK